MPMHARLILLMVVSTPIWAAEPLSTQIVIAPGTPWLRHTIDKTSRGADGVKLGDLNGTSSVSCGMGIRSANEDAGWCVASA